MNAPLPIDVSQSLPEHAYNKVAHKSNEVAGLLAKRLRSDTRGEVLFSAADRGRYATDASIYQVMPLLRELRWILYVSSRSRVI